MSLQVLEALRRPVYASAALGISAVFGILFLYLNQFLFFAPYFIFFVPAEGAGLFALDVLLSALSGVVIALSIFQIQYTPRLSMGQARAGLGGIVLAFVAGACPCYYLVPLLAVAGGAGGTLVTVGIVFEAYQIPLKLLSVALLGAVMYTLERSLRAACAVRPSATEEEANRRQGEFSPIQRQSSRAYCHGRPQFFCVLLV